MFSAPFCYQNAGAYFWCSSIKPYYLINVKHFSGLFKSFLKFFKLYFLSPWTRLFGPLIDRSQAVRYKWCLHIKLHFKKKVNSFSPIFTNFLKNFFQYYILCLMNCENTIFCKKIFKLSTIKNCFTFLLYFQQPRR